MPLGLGLSLTTARIGLVPPSLVGMTLWLNGRAGLPSVGSNVSTWADQSGSGHDFSVPVGSTAPTVVSNGVNGRIGVSFVEASNTCLTNGSDISTFVGAGAWTAFTVLHSTTQNNPGTGTEYFQSAVIGGANQGVWNIPVYGSAPGGLTLIEAYQYNAGVHAVGQTCTTTTDIQTCSFYNSIAGGGTLSISINKAAPSTLTSVPSMTVLADTMQIGTRRPAGSTGNNYGGNIGEIILYNRTLSNTEIINVQNYLSFQWGI